MGCIPHVPHMWELTTCVLDMRARLRPTSASFAVSSRASKMLAVCHTPHDSPSVQGIVWQQACGKTCCQFISYAICRLLMTLASQRSTAIAADCHASAVKYLCSGMSQQALKWACCNSAAASRDMHVCERCCTMAAKHYLIIPQMWRWWASSTCLCTI